MHRKVKFIVASFFLLTFFVLSEAYCNCGYFIVEFDNQTPFNCDVIKSKLIRGYWKTPLIKTIAPYTMSYYEAEQSSAYGPDAEVTLRCGNKDNGYYTFTVRNQQNFCSSAGGKQSNTVPSKDKDINVTNVVRQHAAYWAAKPGIARVTVRKTTDFDLYAAKGLLVDSDSSTLSHPALFYKYADRFHLYSAGTVHDKSDLDIEISDFNIFGNSRLAGNGVLYLVTHDTEGYQIETYIDITEYHNKFCLIPEKNNQIGMVDYNISSYHVWPL